jgi:hypothetical protein
MSSVWFRLTPAATRAANVNGLLQSWFRNGLPQLWCLFAILLGSGGLISQAGRSDGGLFTLALPITRTSIVLTRVGVVLVELYLLALLPLLLVLSPTLGRLYLSADVFVMSLSIVAGGAVFFAIPFLLSSLFEQFWLPAATMLGLAVAITVARTIDPVLAGYTMGRLLRGGDYLGGGSLPWVGLVGSVAISAALIAVAARNIARRDF